MKNASFPRWLARLFAFLFYGQLVAFAFVICLMLSLSFTKPNPKAREIFYIQVPLSGIVSTNKSATLSDTLDSHWLITGDQWALALGVPATLSHAEPGSGTYWLLFSASSWHDLLALPTSLLLGSTLVKVLSLLLSLYICYLFMRLFHSLAKQHIFDQIQVRRLLLMGQGFLLYAILAVACKIVAQSIVIDYLRSYGYGVVRFSTFRFGVGPPIIEFVFFLTGLCILALTQVFKYGLELKQESELTI